ncbi:MAG: hypothetical protein FD127_1578 [Acidimicrobiaceae bacterium]|jgi:hypothetical protein|nr:MAG: hypothetical protein FD127_1578 [Acidimicrobiaceae bacterium]
MVAVAIVASTSCATIRSSEVVEEFAVTGLVLAGPTCPVEQTPPDPECADQPVPAAVIVVTRGDGDLVGEVVTDPTGRFTIRMPGGTYTLTPQPVDGLMGTPPPLIVTVDRAVAGLDFAYDTGIR